MEGKEEVKAEQKPPETSGTTGTPPAKEAGQPAAGKPAEAAKTFTQEDVDRIVAERLEREKGKHDKAADKARAEAEEKALAENQRWQQLAERREKRIGELEPLTAQLEASQKELGSYRETLTAYLKTEKDGLPDPIKALLDKLNPMEQLTWIAENKAALKAPEPSANGKPPAKPVPPTPRNDDQKPVSEAEMERHRREFAETVRRMY